MTTSGTYTFSPTMADCVVNAYGRIKIKADQLTQQHLRDARFEAQLLCQTWANRGVNLWTIEEATLTLTQGTATYTLPASTVSLLDTFLRITTDSVAIDTVLPPVSRTDYASQPDKAHQARPNMFWLNRQGPAPQVSFWPTPDTTYEWHYWRIRQLQDVAMDGTTGLDLPLRFADAFVAGLAYRLARIWNQDLEAQRKADYDEAYGEASAEDVEEGIQLFIMPSLGGYYP